MCKILGMNHWKQRNKRVGLTNKTRSSFQRKQRNERKMVGGKSQTQTEVTGLSKTGGKIGCKSGISRAERHTDSNVRVLACFKTEKMPKPGQENDKAYFQIFMNLVVRLPYFHLLSPACTLYFLIFVPLFTLLSILNCTPMLT